MKKYIVISPGCSCDPATYRIETHLEAIWDEDMENVIEVDFAGETIVPMTEKRAMRDPGFARKWEIENKKRAAYSRYLRGEIKYAQYLEEVAGL